MARCNDPKTREVAALHTRCSPSTLAALADDPDLEVRPAAASNPTYDPEMHGLLAHWLIGKPCTLRAPGHRPNRWAGTHRRRESFSSRAI